MTQRYCQYWAPHRNRRRAITIQVGQSLKPVLMSWNNTKGHGHFLPLMPCLLGFGPPCWKFQAMQTHANAAHWYERKRIMREAFLAGNSGIDVLANDGVYLEKNCASFGCNTPRKMLRWCVSRLYRTNVCGANETLQGSSSKEVIIDTLRTESGIL